MMFDWFKPKPSQPIKRASMDPPVPKAQPAFAPLPVSAKKKPKPRTPNKAPGKTSAPGKDLAELLNPMFGDDIKLVRLSDIPEEATPHLLVMKMQGRLCLLTGGPDDPNLLLLMIEDYLEIRLSLNRGSRHEMQEILSAGIRAQQQDEPEAFLGGKLH